MCSPGIGCLAVETIRIQDTLTDCGGFTISSSLTPTLRCVYLRCLEDRTQLCPTVIETDRCYQEPILSDGEAQQGEFTTQCLSTECDPVMGCVGSPTIINCCQVVVNLTLTPTLRCFNDDPDCQCTYNKLCPELVETDLCHRPPSVPIRGSVARQGRGIGCGIGEVCSVGRGCVNVNTLTPILSLTPPAPVFTGTQATPEDASNDRANLIYFFIGFGLFLLLVLFLVGVFMRRYQPNGF